MTQQDYEELVNKPRKSISSQLEVLDKGGRAVALTPDDILTLQLLRDSCRTGFHFRNTERARDGRNGRRNSDAELLLETLERILKQVE